MGKERSIGLSTKGQSEKPLTRGRILHVINGEHYAGAERVQDLLALNLPDFGYEVGFACVKPDVFPQQRKARDVPLYQTMMKSKLDLASVRSLAEIARIGGYDLIHAHTARSLLFGTLAARISRKPFVYHVHSPTINDSSRFLTNRINAVLERLSLTGVSRLICVSNSLADHMKSQRYDPELIRVVPNGVPVVSRLDDRNPPKRKWVVGCVALFRPRKGIEVLLEALAMVRSYGYDVRLRAVGCFETDGYESEIHTLAKRLRVADAVDWVGFTNNVNAELAKMDLFVLPSLYGEGLPMVVIEAMAAGVPVIGTRVQGIPEVLTKGNGLVAEPACVASLANCIQRVITEGEDWSTIRRNAWQRQVDFFSDHSMARGVAEVYDEVLGLLPEESRAPTEGVAVGN